MRRRGGRSLKTQRLLDGWNVERELDEGVRTVPVGRAHRSEDGRQWRLAFYRDEDGRLCVGRAVETPGGWQVEEGEPFSARSLGYYQRWLRRNERRAMSDER
jgi:hypothetical protein